MKTYDELFKKQIKEFFQKFATVITDYEIVKLPKKADILIIEMHEKLNQKLDIFKYFDTFNIIEFKSAADHFKVGEDDLKISFYINGVLLQEQDANEKNTTFTVVSSAKPVALLKKFKNNIQKIVPGLYKIENIALIPVHIIVINELEGDFTEEYTLLKEFSNGLDLEKFMRQFLLKYDTIKDKDTFDVLLSLYGMDVIKIMKELGMYANLIERNIDQVITELGLKDKYMQEGIEKGIEQGIEKGDIGGQKKIFIKQLNRKFGLSPEEVKIIEACENEVILEIASFKLLDGFAKIDVLNTFFTAGKIQ
ncbi:MAG: hypothetical protein A2015_00910 [Spirochaetes bacterium GWF1_31_7]|nr:MAG: hypothetical protein A2Y30_12770 [Spirochaetes bacterium GWE1_32_154]OHD51679.1 MAG: hypothetical protein A2Y29_04570 [Spirochaetes bacterium GWE2_31_10]OHD51931.1 MAG: hypothetical protein A2015_00910 [Spirochaetes bacterium GWF1_31_7]OHD76095.1 MAG: hypothetical protein A2355_10080 [Spirochaetes bacterium RIFOXYB1_FULL_32_8]HBD93016.1 hypothetical protein [Spirochaetia bacterium]